MSGAAGARARATAPFLLEGYDVEPTTGEAVLRYRHEGDQAFEERLTFPLPSGAVAAPDEGVLRAALRLLHLVAGVSYFKTKAPTQLVVADAAALTPAEHELVRATYDEGLREFAVRNDLAVPFETELVVPGGVAAPAATSAVDEAGGGPALIPFGAGKDSSVVAEVVSDGTLFTVNPAARHRRVAAELGRPLLTATRTLDRVDELRDPANLNGHVPITAIVSAMSVVTALLHGHGDVVMANERSASEPTQFAPAPVNHQFSKSAEYEALFREALRSRVIPVRYFSLLRCAAEVEIVRLLAGSPVLGSIVSCNQSLRQGAPTEDDAEWCGRCPKCLYTYLVLAGETSRATLDEMFGTAVLDDPENESGVAALWNPESKPFECVGERHEAAEAMARLADLDGWRDQRVVQALHVEAADVAWAAPAEAVDEPCDDSGIPAPYRRVWHDAVDGLDR